MCDLELFSKIRSHIVSGIYAMKTADGSYSYKHIVYGVAIYDISSYIYIYIYIYIY